MPPNAGVGSAVGFLAAPVSFELVRSRYMRLDAFDATAASRLLKEMRAEATALVVPGARGMATFERRMAFMRYVGQGHEITVVLPQRALAATDAEALRGPTSATMPRCSSATPQCRDRDPELVGPGIDRGRAARAAGCRTGRAIAKAGRPAAGVRRSQRSRHRSAGLPPQVPAAGQRICRAGDRRRGRNLDLHFSQFCRAYRCIRLYRHGSQGRVRNLL